MAKKKSTRSRKSSRKSEAVQHTLPTGFWSQVAAFVLIAFSLLLVVSWFGAGGPAFNWIRDASIDTIGYATYVLPIISVYVAVAVFRVEKNKLPAVMKFASLLLVVWFASLFGLLRQDGQASTGGVIGDTMNSLMLSLVNIPVGAFIYFLLIIITSLFVLQKNIGDVLMAFVQLFKRDRSEDDANVAVMRKAAVADMKSSAPIADFKLNAGVPMLTPADQKRARLASLKNSVQPDKDAEEKAAMLAVSDPNWRFPSLELLEKKQSPADAGDIQQNAHIIQDTLREFSIDVEMEGANIGPKVTQ